MTALWHDARRLWEQKVSDQLVIDDALEQADDGCHVTHRCGDRGANHLSSACSSASPTRRGAEAARRPHKAEVAGSIPAGAIAAGTNGTQDVLPSSEPRARGRVSGDPLRPNNDGDRRSTFPGSAAVATGGSF